ncbi:MAG: riboflavin synthase [Woeseia sp.]|nr:riboflavin synthase [Woeseia sp.]MBT8095524.1 riboflavin synthase [Woeseia sp.]NNE59868.1 riboflavin synthase [Woeseia sp.]NNL55849.1 riboflavin synthase [Woeseia sp.]
MFTGIIRTIGKVAHIDMRGRDMHLRVTADGLPWSGYSAGDSIAVNGVCLTAVAFQENGFEADISAETLAVTTLGSFQAGLRVNLEPALAVGERLGGHLVSGHVDGIATVQSRQTDGRSERFEFKVASDLSRYLARKGSVSVDGASLTINEVSGDTFAVTIIPHTLTETIFDDYCIGSAVNIEVDMMARYLERLLGADEAGGISPEFLKAHGYG